MRLVSGEENAKKLYGHEYLEDQSYKHTQFNFYYRLNDDNIQKCDSTDLLQKMQEEKWPHVILAERTFSFHD